MANVTAQSAAAAVDYVLQDVLRERSGCAAPTWGPYTATFLTAGVTTINDFFMLEESYLHDLEVEVIAVDATAAPATPIAGMVSPGITQQQLPPTLLGVSSSHGSSIGGWLPPR